MEIHTHLTFGGQCEEAFRFYEKCLGAKITFLQPWEGSPMADQAPAAFGKKMLHATLTLGSSEISGADMPGDVVPLQGFALTLSMKDPAEADRVFSALSAGGTIGMPLQETFWAARFGAVTDQFGVPWMINCEK